LAHESLDKSDLLVKLGVRLLEFLVIGIDIFGRWEVCVREPVPRPDEEEDRKTGCKS
jgi:hypothetical protein